MPDDCGRERRGILGAEPYVGERQLVGGIDPDGELTVLL